MIAIKLSDKNQALMNFNLFYYSKLNIMYTGNVITIKMSTGLSLTSSKSE